MLRYGLDIVAKTSVQPHHTAASQVAGVRAYRFGTLLANDLRAETAVTRAMFELKKVELEVCYAKETTRVAEVQLELFGGGAGVGLGVLTGVLAGQHSSSLLV